MIISPKTDVFYINLDDNKIRNENMKNIMDKLGFTNFKRMSAVDTRTLEKASRYKDDIDHDRYEILKEDIKLGKRRFYGGLTLGSIGCFQSHMNIYKNIIKII